LSLHVVCPCVCPLIWESTENRNRTNEVNSICLYRAMSRTRRRPHNWQWPCKVIKWKMKCGAKTKPAHAAPHHAALVRRPACEKSWTASVTFHMLGLETLISSPTPHIMAGCNSRENFLKGRQYWLASRIVSVWETARSADYFALVSKCCMLLGWR
jgi:hypothetical protein